MVLHKNAHLGLRGHFRIERMIQNGFALLRDTSVQAHDSKIGLFNGRIHEEESL